MPLRPWKLARSVSTPTRGLRGLSVTEIFERAQAGDRRAIGRVLSIAERGGADGLVLGELAHPQTGNAHVVGITGAPGAGKSTLTGRLAATLTGSGRNVAVLAIDPSSPVTGGAILGDRIRMDEHNYGTGTFIRSMATRGQGGGLAVAVPAAIRALDAIGFDIVIVETVGVGQIEIDIAGTADTTAIVVTPGWGDAVQANKAGLLELADVFVVNKADRPGASDSRRDLELMLDLSDTSDWRPEIMLTIGTDGTEENGVDQLIGEIARHREFLEGEGRLAERRRRRARHELRVRAGDSLLSRLTGFLDGEQGAAIVDGMASGGQTPSAALEALLKNL